MSTFDAQVFARELLAEAAGLVSDGGEIALELRRDLRLLAEDIEATLAAIEVEKDSRRALALRQDLEQFMPARKAAILSTAASRASSDTQAALEAALTVAIKAAVAVARAFVPI